MRIGVPKETKNHEYRVGMIPASVHELIRHGHEVFIETSAGLESGFSDNDYRAAGAKIAVDMKDVLAKADLIVKVKEPQPDMCKLLEERHILFTYLHLAPDPVQTESLLRSGCIAIAYETVTDAEGGLPLLAPMSEVAGRMSIQAGAHCLEKAAGGRGVLLGGVPGVSSAQVVVIGGGVVGTNALRMAIGMEASVTVIDKSLSRLKKLNMRFGSRIQCIYSTELAIADYVSKADLVVGAVLLPGATAPHLITRDMVRSMRRRSVIVDVAIDQGGCCETSRPTTHAEPTYEEEGVVHYCVTNMPGAVPRTAAFALNNATLPFILALANKGYKQALLEDPHFSHGLNVHRGQVTCLAVAEAQKLRYVEAQRALT